MERSFNSDQAPTSRPSAELWGRAVYDAEGHFVGKVGSVVRTFDGPVKAVVRTRHQHSKYVLVTLDGAVNDGDAIVVSTVVPGARDAEAPRAWLWHLRGRSALPRRAASPDLIDQN